MLVHPEIIPAEIIIVSENRSHIGLTSGLKKSWVVMPFSLWRTEFFGPVCIPRIQDSRVNKEDPSDEGGKLSSFQLVSYFWWFLS
jgi:hypothetical protein